MPGGFADRLDAGEQLAAALTHYGGIDAIVLGMARGGVVVGFPVARALQLPLLGLVIRKIGAPQNPELALGAVSETGVVQLDRRMVAATGATQAYVDGEIDRQIREARRREAEYHTPPGLDVVRGRTAIVVDDGIATGASAQVAIESARGLGAASVVLAVPVASRQAVATMRPLADEMIVLDQPEPFMAVGLHYREFGQVSDEDVIRLLRQPPSAGSL